MKDKRIFRPMSFDEAERSRDFEIYNENMSGNVDCAKMIKETIDSNFDGYRLKSDAVKSVVERFGYDRVKYVLANTITHLDYDGRISDANKSWANETYIISDDMHGKDRTRRFMVQGHNGLIDVFTNNYRKQVATLDLWDKSQVNDASDMDFTGRIMVLKPEVLKDEYKKRDVQLFYVTHGSGCRGKFGDAVSGKFLIDNERGCYGRDDFLGEAKKEYLPDFAKEFMDKIIAAKFRAREER